MFLVVNSLSGWLLRVKWFLVCGCLLWCLVFQSASAFAFWEPDGIFTVNRVSTSTAGTEGDFDSSTSSVSNDGRYVVFESVASNLVAGDTNGVSDVFVRDMQSGVVTRVSAGDAGGEANGASSLASVSRDGRYVVFESVASNLVARDTNGFVDVFVRDMQTGVVTRVSVNSTGAQVNGPSGFASVSGDGQTVIFASLASDLVMGDTNNSGDVFVRDMQSGAVTRVSVTSAGAEADNHSFLGSVSGDGRYAVFQSTATNLVAGDTNNATDVYVRDMQSGVVTRVSESSAGVEANGNTVFGSVSDDGRYVVFNSLASNLVAGDTNGFLDVFVRDMRNGVVTRLSESSAGAEANGSSQFSGRLSMSGNGRYVVFNSDASNLVAGDRNGFPDVFVRDMRNGLVRRVSVSSAGAQGDSGSSFGSVSADGGSIVFQSTATNLVAGDTNGRSDIFVADQGERPKVVAPVAPVAPVVVPVPVVATSLGGLRVASLGVGRRGGVSLRGRVVCVPVVEKARCVGRVSVVLQVRKSGGKRSRVVTVVKDARVAGLHNEGVVLSFAATKRVARILRGYVGKRVVFRVTSQGDLAGSKPVVTRQKVKVTATKKR